MPTKSTIKTISNSRESQAQVFSQICNRLPILAKLRIWLASKLGQERPTLDTNLPQAGFLTHSDRCAALWVKTVEKQSTLPCHHSTTMVKFTSKRKSLNHLLARLPILWESPGLLVDLRRSQRVLLDAIPL